MIAMKLALPLATLSLLPGILGLAIDARESTSIAYSAPTASVPTVSSSTVSASISTSSALPSGALPSVEVSRLSNGQRIARGLPLLPPTRRATGAKPKRSSMATSSSPPLYVIRLRNPDNGMEYGVISAPSSDNANGDLVDFDPDRTRALRFAFGPDGRAQDGPFDIYPVGDDGLFGGGKSNVLGAIPGERGDLALGSPNYANMGWSSYNDDGLLNMDVALNDLRNAAPTSSDGPIENPLLAPLTNGSPDEAHLVSAQGAMWTYDRSSHRLLAHYRNADGNIIPTKFVTGGDCQHTICLAADAEAFRNKFGSDAVELHVLATVDL